MHKKNRLLALFMTIALLFSSVSFAVSAEDAPAIRVSEIESLREANAETYLMSDGSYECVVYAYDKYYKAPDNTLQLTSSKIVPATGAERSGKLSSGKNQYKNAANAFDVHFSGSGAPEVSIAYQDATVTFSPLTAEKNTAGTTFSLGKVTGCEPLDKLTSTGENTAAYNTAFPNTDLIYVLENNALKEYIILNSTGAGNTFSFLFSLDGVKLQSKDKYAEFIDQNGNVLFSLDSLFAVDANGAFTDNLKYTFEPVKDTNNVIVTVTLDKAYFSSAERVFPIIIDPTVMISSTETADACVCSYTPDTNYQLDAKLRTGMDDEYGIRRTFIKFNIPSYIPEESVMTARIEIEKTSGATPRVKAYQCISSWSSSTITWRNMPNGNGNFDLESTISMPIYSGSNWYSMNVTEIVRDWIDGLSTNNGFILMDDEETLTDHWTTWYSSDAASPHKPELYITYEGTEPEDPDPGDDEPDYEPDEPDPDPPHIYYSYQFTHYYDGSVSSARRNQISNAVDAVDTAFYNQFQIHFSTKDGPLYDSSLTAQDLDVIRIANQLYTYPRAGNEITVLWTDYEPGNYCIHEGTPPHTDYDDPNCVIFDGLALVYCYRPVIHFTELVSADGTDYHYKVAMSLILLHETAHTFGFEDVYYFSPEHASNSMQCVMAAYPIDDPMGLMLFYEGIMNEGCNAFCSACYNILYDLIYS